MSQTPKQEPPRGPIAVESVPWQEWSEGVRFGSRFRTLSDTRGTGTRIGIAIEELPPGKQSCPLHYHVLEEEHILVLEGEMTLRLGDESLPLKAGDYVCFPAGRAEGHCLVNAGEKPCTFVVIGDNNPNEVCVYPDSNKVMVRALDRATFRDGARTTYWDGEKADVPLD